MTLKMLRTVKGSPDGMSVVSYEKGEEYDVPEKLAVVFLTEKFAEPSQQSFEKALGVSAPQNKSLDTANLQDKDLAAADESDTKKKGKK